MTIVESHGTSAGGRRLVVEMESVRSLSAADRDELHGLMTRWFENVTSEQFERDLAEKRWVVLARDGKTGRVGGFSTMKIVEAEVGGKPVNAIYSGDTIVDPRWWNSIEFFKSWASNMLAVADGLPVQPAYWLLLSSGFRTYRLLPTFFRSYVPRCGGSPQAKLVAIRDALASAKFGSRFEPGTGVVRLAHPTPVRPGLSDVTAARLKNPHVRFFVERNPGHGLGDELVCLAELSATNYTQAGGRILGVSGGAARSAGRP